MAARTPITFRLQNANLTSVIPAPGAGSQLVIQRGSLHHRNNVVVIVSLQPAGGAPVFTVSLTAQDSAAVFDFGDGWALPENTALEANLSAAGDVDLNIAVHFDAEV